MTIANKKTPTWLIERVAQDELEAREVETIRERLDGEGRSLESELDTLRASNREILAALPRDTMGAAIRRRAAQAAPPKARRARWALFLAPTVLAGGLAVAMFMVRGPAEETEIKGDQPIAPRLIVYRQKPGQGTSLAGSERLSDGARAARGDLLQLAYDKAPEGSYGVLLSIDGAGRITQHLPEDGARTSAPLTSIREIPLPSAYELDDAPGFERFVLVTAARPFSVGAALDAARALAGPAAKTQPLNLGPDYRQFSVLLHKLGKGSP
jgi:hypothetical protein